MANDAKEEHTIMIVMAGFDSSEGKMM